MNERRMADMYQEDEISLIDIWRTLVKHKKVIFLVWGLISLIGVAAAVLIPQKYAYTTLIEMGGQGDDVVETADAARTRLVAGIIPVIQSRYLAEGKETIDVKVSVPEKSPRFVMLESKGTAQAAAIHLAFQGTVVDALKEGHQVIQNKTREKLVTGQEAARRRIAALDDENALLTAKLERLDDEEAYLKEQIKQVRVAVAAVSKWSDKSAAALTQMMTTNQLEQQRRFLGTLEDRVLLGLPNERAEIKNVIADNERSIDEQRSTLNVMTSELGSLRETQALIPPAQSAGPVAPDRRLIIVLTIFVGLMLGVLGAFFAEFFLKARKEVEA